MQINYIVCPDPIEKKLAMSQKERKSYARK
jgi:hypothetical protein